MNPTPRQVSVPNPIEATKQYPYTRGLDYLRRRSREHVAIADALTHTLPPEMLAGPIFALCDYGAGFGDLCVAVLQSLSRRRPMQAGSIVDVVDLDPRLLAYASEALGACGYSARKLTPKTFHQQSRRYQLILASHVLYYISDRPAAVADLAQRLTRGGQLAVILRSDACDTYSIRSAVRNAPSVVPPEPGRPRLRVADVEGMLRSVGLYPRTEQVIATFRVPVSDVRHRDLYSADPSTDATEFIRFVGHIPTTTNARSSAASAVEQELAARLDGDSYTFRIATAVVTGSTDVAA